MIAPSRKTKLTPPELAKQWGIDVQKVLYWIKAGELRDQSRHPARWPPPLCDRPGRHRDLRGRQSRHTAGAADTSATG